MHIAFFLQFYRNGDSPASDRYYALLRELAKRHRITLFTTRHWYERRRICTHRWVPPGVKLHMFDVPYENEMPPSRRLLSYGRFAYLAFTQALQIHRPDVIVANSLPLSAAWAAANVARLRRVPWIMEVQDLWPAFPIQMGAIESPWLQRALCSVEQKLYAQAAHVIALSPGMKSHISSSGVEPSRVSLIHQGTNTTYLQQVTDEHVEALRLQHGLSDSIVVLYAGSFGRANAIPALVTTARILEHHPRLQFVFMGQGFHRQLLDNASRRLSNLQLLPPQPYYEALKWFKLANLSLVSFIDLPVLAANAPSKLFDSLAAGTAVIITNAGWTKDFVERRRCGWHVPSSAPRALSRLIRHLADHPQKLEAAGNRGKRVIGEKYGREEGARQLETILKKVHQSS